MKLLDYQLYLDLCQEIDNIMLSPEIIGISRTDLCTIIEFHDFKIVHYDYDMYCQIDKENVDAEIFPMIREYITNTYPQFIFKFRL